MINLPVFGRGLWVKEGVLVMLFVPILFGFYTIFSTIMARLVTGTAAFVASDPNAQAPILGVQNVIPVVFTIAIGGLIAWWWVSATRREDETMYIGG